MHQDYLLTYADTPSYVSCLLRRLAMSSGPYQWRRRDVRRICYTDFFRVLLSYGIH